METPLKLRIRFKAETGYYPVWETVSRNCSGWVLKKEKEEYACTFRGNPKTIYGQWLEEQIDNKHKLRWKYKSETGLEPVNESIPRPLWNKYGWHNKYQNEKFSIGYSFWLEDLFIKINNLIEETLYAK